MEKEKLAKLAEFGALVLEKMAAEREWGPDLLDEIQSDALCMDLAVAKDGWFEVAPGYGVDETRAAMAAKNYEQRN